MWPQYQPIGTLEILKSCETSWDLLKKYFHLKSNAVYNSSAKNQVVYEQKFKDLLSSKCPDSVERRVLNLESEVH